MARRNWLNDGAVASYASGSGSSTLTFTYTVATGQNTADLDYASSTAPALNGGSIQDLAGNAATSTLPATGTDGLATQNLVVGTVTLAVTAAQWTSAGLTMTLGSDGKVHIYVTGTTTDVVTSCPAAYVANIQIASPAGAGYSLTIDSTNGKPVTAGRLDFSGSGSLIKIGSGTVPPFRHGHLPGRYDRFQGHTADQRCQCPARRYEFDRWHGRNLRIRSEPIGIECFGRGSCSGLSGCRRSIRNFHAVYRSQHACRRAGRCTHRFHPFTATKTG